MITQNEWVASIHDQQQSNLKNFNAFEREGFWVIQLRPSFEHKIVSGFEKDIPNDHSGIYRYVDNKSNLPGGQVVYIGKGVVRKRLQDRVRKEWKFDEVQSSIIPDEALQYEWENYWIIQHKTLNNGRLPYYNNNEGHSKKG